MNKIELIDKIISRTLDQEDQAWGMDINHFDWVPGVGLYGIYRAWKHTGNQKYSNLLTAWAAKHKEEAYAVKTVNSTAPMSTLLGLYQDAGSAEYLKICVDIAEYIVKEAPRTREGGLEHTVTEKVPGFSEQIWADTLFMVCIFLSRLGRITENKDYSEEAARQLAIHHKVLKDQKTGLFYHGWNCEKMDWMSGALWARANAWITVSTVEMLEELPGAFEGRQEILNSLLQQVEALKKVQRANGMFGTLLDHPDAYDETSATAGFAYGIKRGVKKGYIPEEYLEISRRAEEGVVGKINLQGEVEGVSTGTPIMPSLQDYKRIPLRPTLYGQGLALLMLCE